MSIPVLTSAWGEIFFPTAFEPWENPVYEVIFMKKWETRVTFLLTHLLAFALGIMVVLGLAWGGLRKGHFKLERLQQLISTRFIGEVDSDTVTDAAADAMVNALGDRWSYYLSAEEYTAHMETMNNAYVGIGITIQATEDDSGFAIRAVTEGGPAQEAGLTPGDLLIALDGQDIRTLTTEALRSRVRGEEGTTVSVTVLRQQEELTFTVRRQQFETPVATGQLLSGNVGLVTIENFDSRCAEETIATIESLLDQGAESLIFDVRNNPGGYARELTQVLDYLLPEGEIFHTLYYNGQEDREYSDAAHLDIPMAVLVNGDSYSAAEFFAAALQEYGAATIVGTQTCGKGYFQQTFSLGDGSAVGLSVGKYYTPQGKNLEGVGVTPDICVSLSQEDAGNLYYGLLSLEEDAQVQAALESLIKAKKDIA